MKFWRWNQKGYRGWSFKFGPFILVYGSGRQPVDDLPITTDAQGAPYKGDGEVITWEKDG